MKKSRFDIIAASYEEAINRCPAARTDEQWLLEKLNLGPDDRVLEFTAGSGYLNPYVGKTGKRGSCTGYILSHA